MKPVSTGIGLQVGFYLAFEFFEAVEADVGFYDFKVSVDDVGCGDALDATECGEYFAIGVSDGVVDAFLGDEGL